MGPLGEGRGEFRTVAQDAGEERGRLTSNALDLADRAGKLARTPASNARHGARHSSKLVSARPDPLRVKSPLWRARLVASNESRAATHAADRTTARDELVSPRRARLELSCPLALTAGPKDPAGFVEPTPGFEPGTSALRKRCSTAELSRRGSGEDTRARSLVKRSVRYLFRNLSDPLATEPLAG